jgi:hypothetical protein
MYTFRFLDLFSLSVIIAQYGYTKSNLTFSLCQCKKFSGTPIDMPLDGLLVAEGMSIAGITVIKMSDYFSTLKTYIFGTRSF